MAAHNNVRAFEDSRFHHHRFCFGRHHFLARTAVNRNRSRSVGTREKLRDGDGSSDTHWTLRAMLIAMKSALGAAQGVVFEDDAEIWPRGAALVLGHESSGQPRHRHGHLKVVRLQVRGEFCNGLCFLKTNFRMLRDPVAHWQKLGLHQLLYARNNFVTSFIWPGELRHHDWNAERLA